MARATTNAAAAPAEIAAKTPNKYGFSGDTTTINLFYDGVKYKDPLFVQINGKSFLIRRGENVEIPVEVAEVIRQSLEQDGHAAQLIRGLTSKPQDMGQM